MYIESSLCLYRARSTYIEPLSLRVLEGHKRLLGLAYKLRSRRRVPAVAWDGLVKPRSRRRVPTVALDVLVPRRFDSCLCCALASAVPAGDIIIINFIGMVII